MERAFNRIGVTTENVLLKWNLSPNFCQQENRISNDLHLLKHFPRGALFHWYLNYWSFCLCMNILSDPFLYCSYALILYCSDILLLIIMPRFSCWNIVRFQTLNFYGKFIQMNVSPWKEIPPHKKALAYLSLGLHFDHLKGGSPEIY